ncbi:MAG: FAD:protein FMN transferase, partial [Prevotella sp.]|nr:FAD:protein FMN transferase [Prevotella sp.]
MTTHTIEGRCRAVVHHVITGGNGQAPPLLYAWTAAMHTRVDIAVVARTLSADEALEAVEAAARLITDIEAEADRFCPSSPLSAFNAAPAGQWVPLPPRLTAVMEQCVGLAAATSGLFDVTVGSDNHDASTIRQLRVRTDAAMKCRDGLRVDLCGYIKGVAADEVAALLRSRGVTDALISLGNSSVVAMGDMRSRGSGWSVRHAADTVLMRCCRHAAEGCEPHDVGREQHYGGCEPHGVGSGGAPLASMPMPDGGITLHDEALTTSGNDSPTRCHIVNPLTGRMVTGMRQVAVVTPTAALGEALSTALFAADSQQWQRV